jgi:hypothetical protein
MCVEVGWDKMTVYLWRDFVGGWVIEFHATFPLSVSQAYLPERLLVSPRQIEFDPTNLMSFTQPSLPWAAP